MNRKLTGPQLVALAKFKDRKTPSPSVLGVRRDVAWRLAQMGYLTSIGSWQITRAGMDELIKASK